MSDDIYTQGPPDQWEDCGRCCATTRGEDVADVTITIDGDGPVTRALCEECVAELREDYVGRAPQRR